MTTTACFRRCTLLTEQGPLEVEVVKISSLSEKRSGDQERTHDIPIKTAPLVTRNVRILTEHP